MRLLSFKAVILAVILALVFILFQYTQQENKTMSTPQNVTLHFGQQGVEDFQTYTDVDAQPAGMSFSSLFWTPPNLGTVNIAHEKHTLTLDNTLYALGSSINNNVSKGIVGIDVDAGLNKAEFVEPEEAYLSYRELLTTINQKGWQQYYPSYASRISKQDNLKSIKQFNEVTDPSYILSYEEWSDLFNSNPNQRLDYNLYLDGIVMIITLKRTEVNEFKQEQYLLRYSFNTAEYLGVNLIEGGSKLEGAALRKAYEDTMKLFSISRSKKELELQEQGYTIDEDYQTPDFWEYI